MVFKFTDLLEPSWNSAPNPPVQSYSRRAAFALRQRSPTPPLARPFIRNPALSLAERESSARRAKAAAVSPSGREGRDRPDAL